MVQKSRQKKELLLPSGMNLDIPLPPEFLNRLEPARKQELALTLNGPSPTSIRLNPAKTAGWDVPLEKVAWSEQAYYLPERPLFISDPLWHAGYYYVQEASSMSLEVAWKTLIKHCNESPRLVLDACAAPGGKSTHLLSLMDDESVLLANEIHPKRVQILQENLFRWGYTNQMVMNADAQELRSLPIFFDVILVDAPCSGEGMFRKDLGAREEWSPDNVALCSARQKQLLADLDPLVSEGGFLIYSTCTFNEEENEKQLQHLIDKGYSTIPLPLAQYGFKEGSINGCYRAWPNQVQGEGFFISLLQKNSDSYSPSLHYENSKPIVATSDPMMVQPDSESFQQLYASLKNHPKLRSAGIPITEKSKHPKKPPQPTQEVARLIAAEPKKDFPKLSCTQRELIQLFRGEGIHKTAPKGYVLLQFEGFDVGLARSIGNRLNSLQKKNIRIKKMIEHKDEFTILSALS